MVRARKLGIISAAAVFLAAPVAHAGHPCEAEVASACPDRPGAEMAACLKNPEEHDSKTALSSECTDFIALNNACSEDIDNFCDENHFGDDTALCLTKWTDPDNLSEKCKKVVAWAVPQEEDEEEVERADQNGMSEKDHREKMEWREKRKAARGDAIERMKMKDVDRKTEEDRVALETFKKEKPEEYAAMIQQQEEETRQQIEFKRMERARTAAIERKKRQEAGLDQEEENGKKAEKKGSKKSKKSSSLLGVLCICSVGFLGVAAYFYFKKKDKAPIKNKKKRG